MILTFCCACVKGFAPILTESRVTISPHATKYDKFILTSLVFLKGFLRAEVQKEGQKQQPISCETYEASDRPLLQSSSNAPLTLWITPHRFIASPW